MFIRAEYSVGPDLRFLSNLDMNRMMARTFRRASIPYALSQGFNPHIKFSLGTVLPVGVWGEKEYFDIELSDFLSAPDFIKRLNEVLPSEVFINKALFLPKAPAALMRIINGASYAFVFKKGYNLAKLREDILRSSSLIVKSRGKKKDIEKDLRPGIFKIEIEHIEDVDVLKLWVATNQPINVRYDELLALFSNFGIDYEIIDVYRKGNYIRLGEDFYSPLEKVS